MSAKSTHPLSLSTRTMLAGLVLGVLFGAISTLITVLALGEWHPALALLQAAAGGIVFGMVARILGHGLDERHRIEDELRKLSRAVEQSPSVVVITNLAGEIEYVNPKFTETTGYTPEEVYGRNPRILKSGETPPAEYARMWRTITSGGEWRGEFHNRRKNGELYWEQASLSGIKDASGTITHYLAVKEDITARKEAEDAERASRALAEALRDTAATVNSTLDLDKVVEHILDNLDPLVPHDAATVMLIEAGVGRVQRVCRHADPPLAQQILAQQFFVEQTPILQEIVETRRPVVVSDTTTNPQWMVTPGCEWVRSYLGVPIIHNDLVVGVLRFTSATPAFFTEAHAERVMPFADQVAIAIRNAQLYDAMQVFAAQQEQRVIDRTAELAGEREQLRSILGAMNDGVAYIEGDDVIYINDALAHILGYEHSELNMDLRSLYELAFGSLDNFARMRDDALRHLERERFWRTQVRARRRDGSEFDIEITTVPVSNAANERVGTVSVLRDISQERELQAQRDRFLTHAAHELRTPISNITTRLYLARKQPEQLDTHLTVIDEVTRNMVKLVDDLLDVVRLGHRSISLLTEPVVLQDVMGDTILQELTAAENKGVSVVYEWPDAPVTIHADKRRMAQVIAKLMNNAIHFTPAGGYVALQLAIDAEATPAQAVLRVHDTGPPIPPEYLPRLFEPFFQANEADSQGLGLGLAIAREIVELHGGTIVVESDPERGTQFVVRLVLADPDAPSAP